MNEPPLIELDHVTVTHPDGDEPLLEDVNWRLTRGQFWVLAGDQGSGKSALLATMAGLQRPAAGTVRLKGRDLTAAPEVEQMAWRRQIGFVFEFHGRLLHHLTVLENILLPLQYHHNEQASDRATSLLERAGLSHLAHTLPSRLNHRLQQRVALLRALAFPTEVLFLDNPLNGLGPAGLTWWREFLQQWLAENPLTVVATSNSSDDWAGLATRKAALEGGRLQSVPGAN